MILSLLTWKDKFSPPNVKSTDLACYAAVSETGPSRPRQRFSFRREPRKHALCREPVCFSGLGIKPGALRARAHESSTPPLTCILSPTARLLTQRPTVRCKVSKKNIKFHTVIFLSGYAVPLGGRGPIVSVGFPVGEMT